MKVYSKTPTFWFNNIINLKNSEGYNPPSIQIKYCLPSTKRIFYIALSDCIEVY